MSSLTITNTMNPSTPTIQNLSYKYGKVALVALVSAVGLMPGKPSATEKSIKSDSYIDIFTSKTSSASNVKASNDFVNAYVIDSLFRNTVGDLYKTLSTSSSRLGNEFEEVLVDNLWDMFLE